MQLEEDELRAKWETRWRTLAGAALEACRGAPIVVVSYAALAADARGALHRLRAQLRRAGVQLPGADEVPAAALAEAEALSPAVNASVQPNATSSAVTRIEELLARWPPAPPCLG